MKRLKKQKLAAIASIAALVVIVTACNDGIIDERDLSKATIPQTKEQASEQLDLAREDFYRQINSASKSITNPPEEMTLRDYITGLALEAGMSGDSSKLMTFLDDNGLKDIYDAVYESHNAEECNRILAERGSRSITPDYANSFGIGTIFLWYGISPATEWLIKGHWKHAALRGINNLDKQTITAGSSVGNGPNGVNYYRYDQTIKDGNTSVWWVGGATAAHGQGAVNYAASQLGEPFGIMSAHDDTTAWYCGKIVWRSWYSQGWNIEEHDWDIDNYHILAQAIADDTDTYRIGGDY